MDEPTSNLDFGNQVNVLKEIKKLSERGLGVLMATHSPDHAFLCSTKVVLMQKNSMTIIGESDNVVTEKNLRAAYGIDVTITSMIQKNGKIIKSCIPRMS